jgi:hypothetical protein
MLAAILNNLQNVPQPQPQLPTVHIDRGGGGQSWPRYEIVDIIAAISAFQEIPGEHPVVRAVRRQRWIGEALPGIKDARERREAAIFLAGAQLGATTERAAAEETPGAATAAIAGKLSIEQMIKIVDEIRGINAAPIRPLPYGRGSGGAGIMIGLVIGVAIGAAIVSKQRRRR